MIPKNSTTTAPYRSRFSGIGMLQNWDREEGVTQTNCFAVHLSDGNWFLLTFLCPDELGTGQLPFFG